MNDQNDDQRQQALDRVRRIAGEALTSHRLTDQESELLLLDLALDEHLRRLDHLARTDPVWFAAAAAATNDAWIDKRLGNA